MNIRDALMCLSEIEKSNLHRTYHFDIRVQQREKKIPLDTLYHKILNETPVSIAEQDDNKFKLIYELTDEYDLVIIVSIKNQTTLTINLVTFFIVKATKRMRKDETNVEK